jgi:hypothetical protein
VIQKLVGFVFPLLLSSTHLKLAQNNINTQNRDYEVIEATTGKKTDNIESYAEDEVIQTHTAAVSAIKKALANEGIDTSKVRVLLYYAGLTVGDSQPHRMWQAKPHPDTITSPWLDLTKTVTTSGETRITIRIDATDARLLSDLYSKPEDISNTRGFLSIPTIKNSCFRKIIFEYQKAVSETLGLDAKWVANKTRKNYSCAPEKLREPLLSLFQSSEQKISHMSMIFGLFDRSVYDQLFLYCQDAAEEYYSELYPRLAVRGLQIIESVDSKSNPKPKWWTEIIDQIEPIQECQR